MADKDESDLVMVSNESKEVVKDLIGDPTDTTIVAFTSSMSLYFP
jgi:hypothetical protein